MATSTTNHSDCNADDAQMHAWVTAIAGHDEQALAELYEATLARVYGIALRITRNPQTAEEVSEDVYWQVLRGSASLGELRVSTGDYHLARAGNRHGKISSESGALLYLRGIPVGHTAEVARDLLTAFLPGEGRELITIRASEGEWSDVAPGVSSKPLYDDGHTLSALIRIAADTSWTTPQPLLAHDEECLLLEGDAFFGDTLLRSGDWQLAPVGSESRPISTGKGALVFMRGVLNNRQSL